MHRFNTNFFKRTLAIYVMALLVFGNIPLTAFAALSVDVKANGQDALTLATPATSFDITLTQTDAVSCQVTSPGAPSGSGFAIGSTMTIAPGNPSYPAVGGSSIFTVTCLDAGGAAQSDSVTVSLPAAPATTPTIDVKANGSDGPVTLNSGDTFTYTWASTNATACQQSSPVSSGVSLSGTSVVIASGSPFYPSTTTPTTITITCTDGATTATDSVVINLSGGGGGVGTTPTIDVKANGSDGPVTLNSGDTFTYTWASTNATACQLSSPVSSGISLSGTSVVIGSGDPFYPSVSSPTTISITCTDGTHTASDSVVINLSSGGGGGGPAPTVDVKANGSDGPVTIAPGSTFTYTWTSANATACQQTSPTASGVALSGTSTPIGPGAAFYPSTTTPTVISITCTNGTLNATDSVTINLGSTPLGTVPTVDVKANGSDGPITINNGDAYTYTWVSANATACQMTSPASSGVALSGTSTPITSGVFYPAVGAPVTISITCTDGVHNATDAVVVQLATPPGPGGGGGGGGGSSGGVNSVSGGGRTIIAGIFPGATCPLIHDYMRVDFNNNPLEVMKLQTFLKFFMGYSYVSVNGVFDQATYTAVGAFQLQYKDEILTPWGHTQPTHYVYILTLKKINELVCNHELPITADQQHEITAFRALLHSAQASGAHIQYGTGSASQYSGQYIGGSGSSGASTASTTSGSSVEGATSTSITLPVVGQVDKGQNTNNLATALFTFPNTLKGTIQLLYEFILILIVLYILGTVLKDVLYPDKPENALKRFITKWTTIVIGLVVAIAVSYLLGEYVLLLPLLVVLIGSAVWMALYNQHPKFRSYTQKKVNTTTTTTTTTPQAKPL